jgi:hypothetical protein
MVASQGGIASGDRDFDLEPAALDAIAADPVGDQLAGGIGAVNHDVSVDRTI